MMNEYADINKWALAECLKNSPRPLLMCEFPAERATWYYSSFAAYRVPTCRSHIKTMSGDGIKTFIRAAAGPCDTELMETGYTEKVNKKDAKIFKDAEGNEYKILSEFLKPVAKRKLKAFTKGVGKPIIFYEASAVELGPVAIIMPIKG